MKKLRLGEGKVSKSLSEHEATEQEFETGTGSLKKKRLECSFPCHMLAPLERFMELGVQLSDPASPRPLRILNSSKVAVLIHL